jgi:hypothetical protein
MGVEDLDAFSSERGLQPLGDVEVLDPDHLR